MAKKSWADMTPTQKKVVVVAGIVEVAVTTWCLRDLKQRPAERCAGPRCCGARRCPCSRSGRSPTSCGGASA